MIEHLECIIISESYGDLFQHTLPINKNIIDDILVVTSERDLETQEICKTNNTKYITTNKFFESPNSPFDKEAALNEGLRKLEKKDWILSLDSDIVLPNNFIEVINKIDLDKEIVYGCDRRICTVKSKWEKNKDFSSYFSTAQISEIYGQELDPRPSGYFQLFHSSCAVLKKEQPYLENQDIKMYVVNPDHKFTEEFKDKKILFEFDVLHLGPFGPMNWKGRSTARW